MKTFIPTCNLLWSIWMATVMENMNSSYSNLLGRENLQKKTPKDRLIFNSSDPPISFDTLRGFKDIKTTSNISSPSSLRLTLVKVKKLDSYWHKFFTSDPKSITFLFVKQQRYKPLILYYTSSPVLHVLEKLRKYWSLLQQNHNVNSARIVDPAARTWLNDQEVLKDDLSIEWHLRAHSAQQISNLSLQQLVKCQTTSNLSIPYWQRVSKTQQRTAISVTSFCLFFIWILI